MAIRKSKNMDGDKGDSKARALVLSLGICLVTACAGGAFGWMMVQQISETAVERYKAEQQEKGPVSEAYSGDIVLRQVKPVVANLGSSTTDWVRVETSVVTDREIKEDPQLLVANFRQDLIAFLRTVNIGHLQGPSGLMHFRDDINERARIRSNGAIKEVVLETLIIQ